jgi:hypothetical protein
VVVAVTGSSSSGIVKPEPLIVANGFFPVAATVRLGLSIWQSGKVVRSDRPSPTKKRSRHRAASKIVWTFSGSAMPADTQAQQASDESDEAMPSSGEPSKMMATG